MPETLMPQGRGGEAGEGVARRGRGTPHGVEIAIGITAENHHLGSKILDREAKFVKLNRDRVIATNLTN